MLLVRADLHRRRAALPAGPVRRGHALSRPGRGEVETEGLGILAHDMGYDVLGDAEPRGTPPLPVLTVAAVSLLYVTPVLPSLTGNGLAMRAGSVLRALARHHSVHLHVLPIYARWDDSLVPELASLCEGLTRAWRSRHRQRSMCCTSSASRRCPSRGSVPRRNVTSTSTTSSLRRTGGSQSSTG